MLKYFRNSKEKGFTMVELMIILTILVILAAFAVPNFLNHREKLKDSTAQDALKTVKVALEMYLEEQESYPKNVNSAIDLKKALGSADHWPSAVSVGERAGNISDAKTDANGKTFNLIAVGSDFENCWKMNEKGEITKHKGHKL